MNIKVCTAIFAILLPAAFSTVAHTLSVATPPVPSQDAVIQHLKLTQKQSSDVNAFYHQMESDMNSISLAGFKDGVILQVVRSGNWDDEKVIKQLAAFGQLDQQMRYYRIKYYFNVNQVLTPEQRREIKNDLFQAIN